MVSALLLAAGESRRMGSFKQLLPLGGKSFVECCADNLLASAASEVVVVTGYRQSEVRKALGDRPVRFAHNPEYREGMSSSIKRGVEAIAKEVQAVLIALVDQPHIGPDIFNLIIRAYRSHRTAIVVPCYGGRNGHPVIVDLKLRDEILSMDPSLGLRQVVHRHAGDALYVAVEGDAVLRDFDYPEDYRNLTS